MYKATDVIRVWFTYTIVGCGDSKFRDYVLIKNGSEKDLLVILKKYCFKYWPNREIEKIDSTEILKEKLIYE